MGLDSFNGHCAKSGVKNTIIKYILIAVGSISIIIGTIGIFLPVVPTTPLILLAAACYAASSDKMYCYLVNNRFFGKYIKDYRAGKGIPLKAKSISMLSMWLMLLFSISALGDISMKALLVAIGIFVTIHVFSMPSPKTA
jgi:hypothetical protein